MGAWLTFFGFTRASLGRAPVLLEVTGEGKRASSKWFHGVSIIGTILAIAVPFMAAVAVRWLTVFTPSPLGWVILVGLALSALSTAPTLSDDMKMWAARPERQPVISLVHDPTDDPEFVAKPDKDLLSNLDAQHSRGFAETHTLVGNLRALRGLALGVQFNIARVEIGDNATYASCTHREVQLPTEWADGSVTTTVKQGSFANSATAYVFVVDSNGVASTGYPITFGATVNPPSSVTNPGIWGLKLQGITITR